MLAPDAVVAPCRAPRPPRAITRAAAAPSADPRCGSRAPLSRALGGATVLIIDDDVRNVFAPDQRAGAARHVGALRRQRRRRRAGAGHEHPEVDIVLMDAMMPDQDGYETTRVIRRNHHSTDLPVVLLTAKGDARRPGGRSRPGDRLHHQTGRPRSTLIQRPDGELGAHGTAGRATQGKAERFDRLSGTVSGTARRHCWSTTVRENLLALEAIL